MAVLPINAQGQPREASLEDFERSAGEKYEAAFDLLSRQYVGTGIYVMGYVAEMLLKAAYFRFLFSLTAENATTPIDGKRREAARKEANALSLSAVPHDGYHSINFWALLLVKKRSREGYPFDAAMELDLLLRADRVHQNWSFNTRYFAETALTMDPETVFEDVSWMLAYHERLWRK